MLWSLVMWPLPHRWHRLFGGSFLACDTLSWQGPPPKLPNRLFLLSTPAKYCPPSSFSLTVNLQMLGHFMYPASVPTSAVRNTWGPVLCPLGATEGFSVPCDGESVGCPSLPRLTVTFRAYWPSHSRRPPPEISY